MAVLIGAYALVSLTAAAPPRVVDSPAGAEVEIAARRARDPKSWSVRVDGWYIEVDGVRGDRRHVHLPLAGNSVRADTGTPYDALIAEAAEAAGLDSRLVSAIVFEESGFRADAVSPAGAYGLMQVRPVAAEEVGEASYREPAANLRAGTRYLKHLEDLFLPAHGRDRLALTLAAYNMGPAHVFDAQELAMRLGYDPFVWDGSMSQVIPLLEEPRVYRELRNGYAQGQQVVTYVDRVLDRFGAYRAEAGG